MMVRAMRALKDISLEEKDRQAVERAAAILRERFPVERVVLFGSKARGDDDAESDIDLLLLTSRPMSHKEQGKVIELLLPLELELQVGITPVFVATEEWEHGLYQVLPIKTEVDRDGVLI
jgi:predicted nucleotidyltransferase